LAHEVGSGTIGTRSAGRGHGLNHRDTEIIEVRAKDAQQRVPTCAIVSGTVGCAKHLFCETKPMFWGGVPMDYTEGQIVRIQVCRFGTWLRLAAFSSRLRSPAGLETSRRRPVYAKRSQLASSGAGGARRAGCRRGGSIRPRWGCRYGR
jgi:hypothetical protein